MYINRKHEEKQTKPFPAVISRKKIFTFYFGYLILKNQKIFITCVTLKTNKSLD